MSRIAIVTDSTSDLPPALCRRYGITTVPLNIHFGREVFRDQVEITADEFMDRLQRSAQLPTTSQPSPGLFEQVFRRLAADHDAIVAILISAKLSGTVSSALAAATAVADIIPVRVVDSQNASMGLGLQAIRAAELAADGCSVDEIAQRLAAGTTAYHVVFFADTLEYLQRGGRIGRAAGLVGSLLQLKPVLRIEGGQVVPMERTRTRGRAIQGLVSFVEGLPHIARLSIVHNTTPLDAAQLADRLGRIVPREQIVVAKLGAVIGTHIGPGALGVIVFEGEGI